MFTLLQKGGRQRTAVYLLSHLGGGTTIEGPAIIIDQTSTIVVEPDCTATITPDEGNIQIKVHKAEEKNIGYVCHHYHRHHIQCHIVTIIVRHSIKSSFHYHHRPLPLFTLLLQNRSRSNSALSLCTPLYGYC